MKGFNARLPRKVCFKIHLMYPSTAKSGWSAWLQYCRKHCREHKRVHSDCRVSNAQGHIRPHQACCLIPGVVWVEASPCASPTACLWGNFYSDVWLVIFFFCLRVRAFTVHVFTKGQSRQIWLDTPGGPCNLDVRRRVAPAKQSD